MNLWTWSGTYFGYRDGENLWTHSGKHVRQFRGDEVYGRDGRYLGEIRNGRLIATIPREASGLRPFHPTPVLSGVSNM
ncbi:hypothetical protein ABIA45_003979 [Bradyrhizobium sp. USDA 336]